MANLASLLEDEFESVFLNTDEFAEKLEYTATGRRPRQIVAVVNLTQATLIGRTAHQTSEAGLELLTSTDDVNGIPDAKEGDTIRYQCDTWTFLRIVGGAGNSRTIHFTKVKVKQAGSNRPPAL